MSALVWLVLGTAFAPLETGPATEDFLRQALVVEKQTIDTGITLPQRVWLERDGVRRRAVFKSLEVVLSQVVTVGIEQQQDLRDSWKFEVAAYELDKLLELGMVPPTVARRIDDRDGALIDWVDDILPEFETSPEGFSSEEWQDEVARVWLFDYLAYNTDRTPENLLVVKGFEIRLIDHSRAFQRFLVPMRPLTRFPRSVISNLRRLTEHDLEQALGGYLTKEELEALFQRRRLVLERVDRLLSLRPESEVYFD